MTVRQEDKGRMRLDFLLLIWYILLTLKIKYVTSYEVTFLENVFDKYATKFVPYSSDQIEQIRNFIDGISLETKENCNIYFDRTCKGYLTRFTKFVKPRPLNNFFKLLNHKQYNISDNDKIISAVKSMMIKSADKQNYEFLSSLIRFNNMDLDEFFHFIFKKSKKFIRSIIFEAFIPFYLKEDNKHVPRFLDEIADEIDVLENKKDTIFSRNRLKRLLIPMLIVLKIFKLKLLLFLPLILGLVSFKKFLGLLIFIIPSFIGFFKVYTSIVQVYTPPVYSPSGVGFPLNQNKETHIIDHDYELYKVESPQFLNQNHGLEKVGFEQQLAYQGYNNH